MGASSGKAISIDLEFLVSLKNHLKILNGNE
jgi:hypothetical protein